MARTTGTKSLRDLLEAGVLNRNERLVINRRSREPIEGTLQSDGRINVSGSVYESPSAAARNALDVGTVDGWLRWRVPRLDGRSLADVRDSR